MMLFAPCIFGLPSMLNLYGVIRHALTSNALVIVVSNCYPCSPMTVPCTSSDSSQGHQHSLSNNAAVKR